MRCDWAAARLQLESRGAFMKELRAAAEGGQWASWDEMQAGISAAAGVAARHGHHGT